MLYDVPKTAFKVLMEVEKTIPAYQRDFVWESDDVSSFIENLYDAYIDGRDTYFCGSMVLYYNQTTNKYEIVDGQQRISVIFILLAKLINSFPGNTFMNTHKENFIVESKMNGSKRYKFWHRNIEIMNFISEVTSGDIKRDEITDESIAQKSLYDCHEAIDVFVDDRFGINDKKDAEKIDAFIRYITEKCFVVHYLANDMADALLTYSRLNSGGKKLVHTEVLKGLIYAAAEKKHQDWDALDKKWSDFWDKLTTPTKIGSNKADKAKELIKQESFLAYFLLSYYPNEVNKHFGSSDGFPPISKLTEFLQGEAGDKLFKDPMALMNSLNKCVDRVLQIRTGIHSDKDISNYYRDIALLSQTQTQPLIFILGMSNNDIYLKELLGYVFKLTFIFTSSVNGTGSTAGTWRSLAKNMRDLIESNINEQEVVTQMKYHLKEKIQIFYESHFYEHILKKDIFSNTNQLKKVLRVLEIIIRQNVHGSDNRQYADWYGLKKQEADHINPKDLAAKDAENNNMIGNAALLNKTVNGSLKKLPFDSEKKQSAYKRSKYFHARAIVIDSSEGFGWEKNAINQIKTTKYLDDNIIYDRSLEIEEIFRKYLLSD